MKLCKDCKHYFYKKYIFSPGFEDHDNCNRRENHRDKICVITGTTRSYIIGKSTCFDERIKVYIEKVDICGVEGKYWEEVEDE